jgi:hypothetical protein
MPGPRSHLQHAVTVLNGEIIVGGGDDVANHPTNQVFVLQPGSGWSVMPTSLPKTTYACVIGSTPTQVIVAGGLPGTTSKQTFIGTPS